MRPGQSINTKYIKVNNYLIRRSSEIVWFWVWTLFQSNLFGALTPLRDYLISDEFPAALDVLCTLSAVFSHASTHSYPVFQLSALKVNTTITCPVQFTAEKRVLFVACLRGLSY